MKLEVKQVKIYGLEWYRVVCAGVVLHEFPSYGKAKAKYMELLTKIGK